ncbi:MAG: hypothetical protein ACFB0C_24280 [Leptolyngbyaceae cyanobacterium]
MSELLWNQIPFVTAPSQDDELLLVNGSEQTRRIKQKDFVYGQLLTLDYLIDPSQNAGVGSANTWGLIPFNSQGGGVSLNADGSFSLGAGLYMVRFFSRFAVSNKARMRLQNISDGVTMAAVGVFSNVAAYNSVLAVIEKKIELNSGISLGLQFNVEVASGETFNRADSALAGLSISVAQGFIWKLG